MSPGFHAVVKPDSIQYLINTIRVVARRSLYRALALPKESSSMRLTLSRRLTVCVALSLALGSCGGGGGGGGTPKPQTYTIGGAVSGLASGESVTLANNGTDTLTVSGNNTFT